MWGNFCLIIVFTCEGLNNAVNAAAFTGVETAVDESEHGNSSADRETKSLGSCHSVEAVTVFGEEWFPIVHSSIQNNCSENPTFLQDLVTSFSPFVPCKTSFQRHFHPNWHISFPFSKYLQGFSPTQLKLLNQLIFLLLFYPVHIGNDKLEYYFALWTGLDDGFLELLGTSPLPNAGQEVCVVAVGRDPKPPLRGWWFLTQHFHTGAAHLHLTGLESKGLLHIKLKCCHAHNLVSLSLFLVERVKHLLPTYQP